MSDPILPRSPFGRNIIGTQAEGPAATEPEADQHCNPSSICLPFCAPADSTYGCVPDGSSDFQQNAGPASMDAGFPLFDVGSLAPAGNWVSNQFLQDIELSLAYGYASPSAPAPLGGTGSEPDERAAVCTDSSTVGHEYPGGVKISHAIMVECAETCYFWCEDDVPFAKKTTYQCVNLEYVSAQVLWRLSAQVGAHVAGHAGGLVSGQSGRMWEGSFGRAVIVLTGILMREGRVLSGIARREEQAYRVLCSVRSETATAMGILEVSFTP
ncbi:hypothetical protein N657DRAFT_257720 [Parathielavia appendiculata]|uniref:Uncharacterized protein n=1 Tax=Parathielavia appendiculata TaxID=2587402 RepID=A0AAN6TRM5_9PEZI|nr:hypothetical protein N657DRAFT_257720 [Parathielavia appendiculata]